MATQTSLDGAVDREFKLVPGPARETISASISEEEAVQTALDTLMTLAENHPAQVRDAVAQFAMARPEVYQRAFPHTYDGQTGLAAKAWFESIMLPQQMEEAKAEGATLTYLILDIDGFKGVNDQYGHPIGDEVISYIADILKQETRGLERNFAGKPDSVGIMRNEFRREDPEYTVARVGNGEEFAVILYGTSLEDGYQVAERLRQAVADHHIQTQQGELSVTVSIGAAELEPGMTPYQLIEKADNNLKAAKQAGKNRVYADGYLAPPEMYAPPENAPIARVA